MDTDLLMERTPSVQSMHPEVFLCFRLILEAHQIREDYRKEKLKDRLKEIAATLEEDSNPVIMLIKHKK